MHAVGLDFDGQRDVVIDEKRHAAVATQRQQGVELFRVAGYAGVLVAQLHHDRAAIDDAGYGIDDMLGADPAGIGDRIQAAGG